MNTYSKTTLDTVTQAKAVNLCWFEHGTPRVMTRTLAITCGIRFGQTAVSNHRGRHGSQLKGDLKTQIFHQSSSRFIAFHFIHKSGKGCAGGSRKTSSLTGGKQRGCLGFSRKSIKNFESLWNGTNGSIKSPYN